LAYYRQGNWQAAADAIPDTGSLETTNLKCAETADALLLLAMASCQLGRSYDARTYYRKAESYLRDAVKSAFVHEDTRGHYAEAVALLREKGALTAADKIIILPRPLGPAEVK
jgi:hypothetical protein